MEKKNTIVKPKQSYNSQIKDFPERFGFNKQTKYIQKYCFYDPDTFLGVLEVENKPYTFSFRMLGYDAIEKKLKKAETQSLSLEDLSYLKQKYQESYDFIMQLVSNKTLKLECFKPDLYNRTLVNVYVKSEDSVDNYDICVNTKILESGFVFPYTEQNLTKKTLKEQVEYLKEHDLSLVQQKQEELKQE